LTALCPSTSGGNVHKVKAGSDFRAFAFPLPPSWKGSIFYPDRGSHQGSLWSAFVGNSNEFSGICPEDTGIRAFREPVSFCNPPVTLVRGSLFGLFPEHVLRDGVQPLYGGSLFDISPFSLVRSCSSWHFRALWQEKTHHARDCPRNERNLGSLPAKSLTRYYASLFLPDQTMKREKKVWSGLDGNFSPGDPFPVIRDKIKEEAATEILC